MSEIFLIGKFVRPELELIGNIDQLPVANF